MIVCSSVRSSPRLSGRCGDGSFGWDGLYGTQVRIDLKEKMVTLIMIQEQVTPLRRGFEKAVMQAMSIDRANGELKIAASAWSFALLPEGETLLMVPP